MLKKRKAQDILTTMFRTFSSVTQFIFYVFRYLGAILFDVFHILPKAALHRIISSFKRLIELFIGLVLRLCACISR